VNDNVLVFTSHHFQFKQENSSKNTLRYKKIKMETKILREMIKMEARALTEKVGENIQPMTNKYNKMIRRTKSGYSDKVNHFMNCFIRISRPH